MSCHIMSYHTRAWRSKPQDPTSSVGARSDFPGENMLDDDLTMQTDTIFAGAPASRACLLRFELLA